MGRFLVSAVIALCTALAACEGDQHKEIHGHIHVVVNRDDALVAPAAQALAAYQTRALPQIETALHTARPVGRLRLIEILGQVRHVDTVPLLRHFAVFDPDPRVRGLAETTLSAWRQAPFPALAEGAESAVKWIAGQRAQGLGPVVREE